MPKKLKPNSDYFQPDFYRFSQDSTKLAKIVADEMVSLPEGSWCMDVGAGCGVLGIEIIKNLGQKINFDFLEIQKEFKGFFYKNLNLLEREEKYCNFHNVDFRKFSGLKKYSLIVSNPPYFLPGKGRQSLDPRKNKCRFFIDGSYRDLLNFFKSCLLPEGKGYILYRENGGKGREGFQELFLEFGSYFLFSKRSLDKKTNLLVVSILDKKGN